MQAEDERVELLADADRPGGWLLLIDRIRQSYVDLDDPTFLDFEYVQAFADVVGALPAGPLAVTHIGGGACTLARWVAATRPGSSQIVLEPDTVMTDLVRARLPLPKGERIRIRAVDGRAGLAGLRDASADVVVLDAFHGGRVPPSLTTSEALGEVARVLRPGGVFLANVADGPPVRYTRRLVATVRTRLPELLLIADPSVLKARRFGNVVLAASRQPLPLDEVRRASARAPFPRSVTLGLGGDQRPLTDADPMRSPEPPDELWRVQ
ncbi:spermidine synthase [Jatrophihabitans endophyticus]|uniref:spermidine synthase n=1 Tax=Jatrophihabitans endophyticus TaxID=1206085 RepID=UPI001A084875|nr:fused MFS/spermidine synthase [Jatrophihabitans endophyticus]MBE7188487.1 fused MFS/spermidine synthase [Jatrophihabitans endophyticus]